MNTDQVDNEQIIQMLLTDYETTLQDARTIKAQLDDYQPEPEEYEEKYMEMLDEQGGHLRVEGQFFFASDILKHCDPTAFRCNLADYADSEFTNDKESSEGYVELDAEYMDLLEELQSYKAKLKRYGYDIEDLEEVE